ncbi:MAG TPA: acireductone synthase [Vicinamibacterales bacterium]|nr:acireductone synthase [Vicinamibacterales bacterium]
MSVSLSALGTRAILLDVEGTTTPVEFVYQVLFPFARAHAAAFLEREGHSPPCLTAIEQLRRERAMEAPDSVTGAVAGEADAVLPYVYQLMDSDRKSPGLKALQGLIWQEGFRSGELRGQVYSDVPPAFERWRAGGRVIYIYSSGSVLAQQLLFATTGAGDLTMALNGHFDTAVGPKTSADSYRRIAQRIAVAPPEILFVSDVAAELDAAQDAGLRTLLCVRAQPAPAGTGRHPPVESFDHIEE